MTSQTILVVEDDEAIRDMVVFNLDRAGYRSLAAGTCQEARVKIADERPDLILLDWMLPDMSGLELARSLRRDELTRELPIIMLTARAMEDDKVRGLDSGVDDYVTKPFGARELIARIHALLRRTQPGGVDDEIEANGLVINVASHRVLANGKPVEVGPTEYRMLKFFMTHQDRVYSRAQLLDHVWGSGVYVEERTVDGHILRLRKALEKHGYDRYVQTVRGAGYRFSVTADN
jgi:two-component system, OmpR family, phosphate regulon response regulator PhoB